MRRRMMMGKETPIQYLKRIGCKLWLPLNSEHGLEAAIGNTRIVNVVSNAVTIDSSQNMGLFTVSTVNKAVASLTTDWSDEDFPNDEWTLFSQGKQYSAVNLRGVANVFKFISGSGVDFVNNCFNSTGTINSANWNSELQTCFSLVDSAVGNRIHFSESGTKTILPEGASTAFAKPNKEATISVANYYGWSADKRIFLKNVMIFNRHLTEEQMQKVMDLV